MTNERLNLADLKAKSPADLLSMAEELEIENASTMRKGEMMFSILKEHAEEGFEIGGDGVLEVLQDGFGFLRSPEANYLPGPDDIYVSPDMIRQYSLRTGDTVEGVIRAPGEKRALLRADQGHADQLRGSGKGAPQGRLRQPDPSLPGRAAEDGDRGPDDQGQVRADHRPRGADRQGPARPDRGAAADRQDRAAAEHRAFDHRPTIPECYLIVLLIDERPEEVTDMQRSVKGEVISSTFDEPATRHVAVAEMVIEKAKRLVEHKRDVVILLDSITRLGRAYNTVVPSSGKVLTGGVDANALQRPKRFFGAARNIEEGGSLTIIATALIDTGSRMDEVIFEEFKGTGNSEIVLDRKVADKRVFPAMDILKSGTRKEDLLVDQKDLQKTYVLRRILNPMGTTDAIEFLISKLKQTKTNGEFFESMNA